MSAFFGADRRHDPVVEAPPAQFAQGEFKNLLELFVRIEHEIVLVDDHYTHRRILKKLLETRRLYQNLLFRALAIGDVATNAH